MNCRRVQNKLSQYIDGELSVGQASRLAAHLAECDRCRAEDAALRHTIALAQRWSIRQPGPELQWRLDPAVLAQRARERESVPWTARLQFLLAPATTSAAAALLVVALWSRTHPWPVAPPRMDSSPAVSAPDVSPTAVELALEPEASPRSPGQAVGRITGAASGTSAAPYAMGQPARRHEAGWRAPSGEVASRPVRERADRRRAPLRAEPRLLSPAVAASNRRPASAGLPRSAGRPAPAAAARATTPMPTPEPITLSQSLYASGRYNEAVGVLNAAFERSSGRFPDKERSLYTERNALADSAIVECSAALRDDPGNQNARKFLDEAYETKVKLLRSLAS